MREPRSAPPAQWTLYGLPFRSGLAIGIGAPLYLPTYGTPLWLDPRLLAQDEDEWHAIEYRMPTEPVEVIGLTRDLNDIPPVLAPYVRIVGWIVERAPEPPLPQVPILIVPKLPAMLPPEATVILDANAGVAYIVPDAATLARYQSLLLRTATHARYHLESEHLPISTWDDKRIAVGSAVSDWDAAPRAAQAGADLVWLQTDALPESITTIAHALGGKPVWLHDRHASTRDDAHWRRLLRLSAELNLTLFVDAPDALAEVRDSLEVAREALRAQHTPIGALPVGLTLPADAPLHLDETAPPYAVCWRITQFTPSIAESLWEQHAIARNWGVRRAMIIVNAEPETLALALGYEPHTLFLPPEPLRDAKTRLALLSTAECRDWLLLRLHDWENPALQHQPQESIAARE
ncbi:MAG: hypothetical protein KatS3mg017_0769 [Fimbriimonadales bacterium]|nr:MAG: hypothetical protein KatS3mg017_0769 [Fimbriimonadales bacterium]